MGLCCLLLNWLSTWASKIVWAEDSIYDLRRLHQGALMRWSGTLLISWDRCKAPGSARALGTRRLDETPCCELKAVFKILSDRIVVAAELGHIEEVVSERILLSHIWIIGNLARVVVIEKLLVVIGFRATLVPFLSHDLFMDKHLVSGGKVPSYKHVSLLKVVKEVLLMDSLRHPGSTVVRLLAILIDRIGLLRLIIVAHRSVKIPLFPICCFRPAPIPRTKSTPWLHLRRTITSRLLPDDSTCAHNLANLRLAHKTVPLILLADCAWIIWNSLIIVVIVYLHSHCSTWILTVCSILPNRGPWLNLLRGTGSTPCSHIMKTVGFLHVLKIQSARIWRAYLLYCLAVLLFKFLKGDPFLLRGTQVFIPIYHGRTINRNNSCAHREGWWSLYPGSSQGCSHIRDPNYLVDIIVQVLLWDLHCLVVWMHKDGWHIWYPLRSTMGWVWSLTTYEATSTNWGIIIPHEGNPLGCNPLRSGCSTGSLLGSTLFLLVQCVSTLRYH